MTGSRRIALFSDSLGGGGAERVLVTLANAFHRAGHAVDVVLVSRSGKYLGELDDSVRVVDLDAGRTLFALVPLARYLRRARPAALLSNQNHVNVVAVMAAMLARWRGRLVVREAITVSTNIRHKREFKAHVIGRLIKSLYRRAYRVVAPSQGVADDLVRSRRLPAAHITIIPNPLEFERIDRLAAEKPPGFPDEPVILGVGRLNMQKDFTTLLRAFAAVAVGRARLVILGEGEERAMLESLARNFDIAERVSMPGFVENPFAWMKRASVYVLSSRYEGLPNTLLQALAVGTPSVATDCPSGPWEILDGGRWGRLVPVGDVASMTKAIEDGLDGRIEAPPRSVLVERYDSDAIARRYLDLMLAD